MSSYGEGDDESILKASHVYLLMSSNYRISRNRRAEWFFSHLNTLITVSQKYKLEEFTEELETISVIPKDSPPSWSIETRHLFRYLVCSDTIIEILSRKHRIIYCLDISPSVATVDVQSGIVLFDAMFGVIQDSMEGLVMPFYVPGSYFIFKPKIYLTVIAHAPFLTSQVDQVLIQGVLLDSTTVKTLIQTIFKRLSDIEVRVADLSSSLPKIPHNFIQPPLKMENKKGDASELRSLAMSPDFGLVDLLRQALIALNLLPENSSSGLIILSDGVISVPDGAYLDMILSQLRYNTVSCSFIQLSSPFHPHASYGILPYADLMRFISTATFGVFLTSPPKIKSDSQAMNIYHKSFITWSFQKCGEGFKNNSFSSHPSRPGEWSVQNKCFSIIRDMPIVKKQQHEDRLDVEFIKVLSCRLREGFTIKEVIEGKDRSLEIKLVLPWKFLISLEYSLETAWPPVGKEVRVAVSLEGPYDFLHDVTCLAKKPFVSFYRQLLVNRYWTTQKQLLESDKLLVHMNLFSSNAAYYSVPERLRNGHPLFDILTTHSSSSIQSNECAAPAFSQFWKPMCHLDTDIWQKWMHTHRIGIILEHDHPLPKHLHMPNSSGRFQVIQCRQTMTALCTLLKDWSSFVLIETHSYIKFLYKVKEKPFSFVIVRIGSKPPCVILRLAFLVGTPGSVRHETMTGLRSLITSLTFPQRLTHPPKWRVGSGSSASLSLLKRTWSDMPSCVLLHKPIEKILISYEQAPRNFSHSLLPQSLYNSCANSASKRVTSKQSTFGFRPTYSTPSGSHLKMGPEMFNTVARYLCHRRWIWGVHEMGLSTSLSPESVARILTTLTKMRLQEGLRFGYCSNGIINMIIELDIKDEHNDDVENIEDYERTTCALQYVIFPPATSITKNGDEDDDEDDDDEDESGEKLELESQAELYLVTECWIEPQAGKILNSSQNESLSNLEYSQVANKIFDMDGQCISSLLTYEHLSLKCQNPSTDPLSSKLSHCTNNTIVKDAKACPILEPNIKYIPFRYELDRILPKCRQSELLFSSFNQEVSLSYPAHVEICEKSNSTLYSAWVLNVSKFHDKEHELSSSDHRLIYELIVERKRALGVPHSPILNLNLTPQLKKGVENYPEWRCFVKRLNGGFLILSLLPATFHDLKLLMLSQQNLRNENYTNSPLKFLPKEPTPISSHPQTNPEVREEKSFEKSEEGEVKSRKRLRVKSGGEGAPVSKRSLNRKSSSENLRFRAYSIDNNWKTNSKETTNSLSGECVSPPPPQVFEFPDERRYVSLTLPLYLYDSSLHSLTEHVIFRSISSNEDIYIDDRIGNGNHLPQSHTPSTQLPTVLSGESLASICSSFKSSFRNAFVHAIFRSLQEGNFVHKNDIQEAIRLCEETKIRVDLTEFIQTICGHLKVSGGGDSVHYCDKMKRIHEFIKQNFTHTLLSSFQWVADCPGIFYFKLTSQQLKSDTSLPQDLTTLNKEQTVLKGGGGGEEESEGEYFGKSGEGEEGEVHTLKGDESVCSKEDSTHTQLLGEDMDDESSLPVPLFMYLSCTYTRGDDSHSFLLHDIPTCLDEIEDGVGERFSEMSKEEGEMELSMDFVFLTLPSEKDKEMEYSLNFRTSSTSSISPIPQSDTKNNENITLKTEQSPDQTLLENDGKMYPNLTYEQYLSVKTVVDEVKWLLKDEMTSFRWESGPISALALTLVANHVEKSPHKPGCKVTTIPLKFVNNAHLMGYENFKQRFRKLSIEGFDMKEEGSWVYLVKSKASVCEQGSSILFPESSGVGGGVEFYKRDDEVSGEDAEVSEITRERSREISVSSSSVHLITPTQLSDISTTSIIDSINTFEDGYDGDGSESGEFFTKMKNGGGFDGPYPPFWMLFKISPEEIAFYFHCRYDESNLGLYNYATRVRDRVIRLNKNLKRLVNQDILLQQLHETKLCSDLLEPDNDSEDDELSNYYLHQRPSAHKNKTKEELDQEALMDPTKFKSGTFSCDVVWETKFSLHSRLRTGPGKNLVSCGIQTLKSKLIAFLVQNRQNMFVYRDSSGNVFYLRFYRVPQESVLSDLSLKTKEKGDEEGVKVDKMRDKIELNENMGVIVQDKKPEDSVQLLVYGVTEAGPEIKNDLVQSLSNKLDDAVLDILSLTLDRNPYCKLTPEDVSFIQKPSSHPDNIIQYEINKFGVKYLQAFAFYFHQNLLQVFHMPKYTDSKAEGRFRDIDERRCEEGVSKMYLYNQNPNETGSRGIAAVSVSIIESNGENVKFLPSSSDKPSPLSYQENYSVEQLSQFLTLTQKQLDDDDCEGRVFVELRVWRQGRINLDIFKHNICSGVRHALWDLVTEFYFLTAPLSEGSLNDVDLMNAPDSPPPPTTPEGGTVLGGRSYSISNSALKAQNKSNNGTNSESNYVTRLRSLSVSVRKTASLQLQDSKFFGQQPGRASSPLASPPIIGQNSGVSAIKAGRLNLRQLGINKLESGDAGHLHNCYHTFMTSWYEIGHSFGVPSLRQVRIPLVSRHKIDVVVSETVRLIEEGVGESPAREFWWNGSTYNAGGSGTHNSSKWEEKKVSETEFNYFLSRLLARESFPNYVEDCREVFTTSVFSPRFESEESLIIARNFIQWKASLSPHPLLSTPPDAYKSLYKFGPQLSENAPISSPYVSLEKLPRNSSLGAISESNQNSILIPRQRLLMAKVTNSQILYTFYNWSQECIDRLMDSSRFLALWSNARHALLTSIYAQKSGLYYNQPISRSSSGSGTGKKDVNQFTCGGTEIENLLRFSTPPKDRAKKAKSLKNLEYFLECFRNIKHQNAILRRPESTNDIFKYHDQQISQIRSFEKAESKNSIFQLWLSRGPSASNLIGPEGITAFKQSARLIHYCLTPILFSPQWRQEVALTRDNTISNSKKGIESQLDTSKKPTLKERDRHSSGFSLKSVSESEGKKESKKGGWDLNSASSPPPHLHNEDKWNSALCESFIQDYMQYLQTLGFVPIHPNPKKTSSQSSLEEERGRHLSGNSLLSNASTISAQSMGISFSNFIRKTKEESILDQTAFYLQKSSLGGIILFELGLSEPFFYGKIHILEATRIATRKNFKKSNYGNVLEFVNECERMKDLMHLHSFTYDFHLRSIYSYIIGRQSLFKPGYHITSFLDDFVKYYPKGPSFARNTVHIRMLTVQNVSTPAQILYNYMLEKLYDMKVIRLNLQRTDSTSSENEWEYILVHNSSKKIIYNDSSEKRQLDDFDLTLLISHASSHNLPPYSSDPSVLRLNYYIILTSRREVYPKVNEESGEGRLELVNTSNLKAASEKVNEEEIKSEILSQDNLKNHEKNEEVFNGIREEPVQYMGYFSSHEQLMSQIVKEQKEWVEEFIFRLVTKAAVDCRRDLLWKRLLVGDKIEGEKVDLIRRETVGALSYWEFGELLELVKVKSLSEMDLRLSCLLNQPQTFYESLLKLFMGGGTHSHRYFAAPDKTTHQLALFKSDVHISNSVVILEINLERKSSELSVMFKQPKDTEVLELSSETLGLIETVINICCYCSWINMI